MSEDNLNKEARKAYAQAQQESDAAQSRVKLASVKASDPDSQQKSESESKKTKSPKNQKSNDSQGKASDSFQKEKNKSASAKSRGADQGESEAGDAGEVNVESEDSDELCVELSQAQEERISQLNDELARCRADLYNLQQEYNAYVRRTKSEIPLQQEIGAASVVSAVMSVLDDIALAREHKDLNGTFKAVAEKLESTLESKFKVKRYGKPGDAFDPNLHQAIQMAPGADAGGDQVIDQLAQPGYLMGETVLRPAMVIVGADKISE